MRNIIQEFECPSRKQSVVRGQFCKFCKVITLMFLAVILGACGSTSKSSSSLEVSSSTTTSNSSLAQVYDGLNLVKLGSLTNYVAVQTDNGQNIGTYKVHSPTDWEMVNGGANPLYVNINGFEYTYVPNFSGSQVTYSWQKSGSAQPYDESPYPSYVKGLIGLTKVSGVKLVRESVCTEAGLSGHIWKTVPSIAGAVAPNISACIADSSGVLLSYDQGTSSSIYGNVASFTQTFTITSIATVPTISVR